MMRITFALLCLFSALVFGVDRPSVHSSSESSTECTWYSTTTTLTISVYTTSTVPTPSGFTPIHGETPSDSNGPPPPFPTATPSSLSTSSDYRTTVAPVTTSTSKPCFATTTSITETLQAPPFYAACNSDNVISTVANNNDSIYSLDIINVKSYSTTITPDAYACCITCMDTPGCAFSGWKKDGPVKGNPVCELWFQDKCDGSLWLGSSFYDGVGEAWTVANGACGQIYYGGPGE